MPCAPGGSPKASSPRHSAVRPAWTARSAGTRSCPICRGLPPPSGIRPGGHNLGHPGGTPGCSIHPPARLILALARGFSMFFKLPPSRPSRWWSSSHDFRSGTAATGLRDLESNAQAGLNGRCLEALQLRPVLLLMHTRPVLMFSDPHLERHHLRREVGGQWHLLCGCFLQDRLPRSRLAPLTPSRSTLGTAHGDIATSGCAPSPWAPAVSRCRCRRYPSLVKIGFEHVLGLLP